MRLLRSLSLLALASAALVASAQTGFYGGDPNFPYGIASSRNTDMYPDLSVYDDFTLGQTTNVQSFFGNFLLSKGFSLQGLQYEIRQGVSSGNAGTLLYSGSLSATSALLGSDVYDYVRLTGSPTGITLGAGTYFLGLFAVGDGTGDAFLAATTGANGVGSPVGNDNAFVQSTQYGYDYLKTGELYGSNYRDFSLGVVGSPISPTTPGPAAALPFALMALRRRKKA